MQITRKEIIALLLTIVLIMPLFCFFSVNQTLADTFWEKQEGMSGSQTVGEAFGYEYDDPDDIRLTVAGIIRIILGFLGIIFVVLIIYAGYKWMTAAGNENKVDEARKMIVNATIGLIIVLAAYGITYFITKAIYNTTIQ